MVRFLASSLLTILANAIGLLVASWLLPGLHLSAFGFLISVVFFTLIEVLLGPFILKMAVSYLPALRGGVALVTVFVSLLLTSLLTDGLEIDGLGTWLLAPFVVWVIVLLAGILLPMVLFKNILADRKNERRNSR